MVSTILAALSTVFFLSPFWIDVFTGSVYSRAPMFTTSFPERKKETWELVFHLRFLLVAPSPSKIIWKKEKLNTRKQKKKNILTFPIQNNRPFPSSKKSHLQSEAKCEAIDMKMIFNYDANKTHFHNKGFALSLVLKVRVFGTRKWPIGTAKVTSLRVLKPYFIS